LSAFQVWKNRRDLHQFAGVVAAHLPSIAFHHGLSIRIGQRRPELLLRGDDKALIEIERDAAKPPSFSGSCTALHRDRPQGQHHFRANTMSMHMRVFFAGPRPTPAAVTESMGRLGLDFAITDHELGSDNGGFMPMSFGKGDDALETGVEVYLGAAGETIDELGIEGIDPKLENEICFRWSSDLMEGACALALAAAIATLTGGVIFEDYEGVIISVETAVEYCREGLSLTG
jgi:hypothetical protein